MSTKPQGRKAQHDTTPETNAAGPGTETPVADPGKAPTRWLWQLANRIEDLAQAAGMIACFKSSVEHDVAQTVAARGHREPFATSFLMRMAKRQMHGKSEAEQREIEKWYRDLWEKPPIGADEFLDGGCAEFFSRCMPAIEQAQALATEIAKQIQIAQTPWRDLLRGALAAVLPMAQDGPTFLDDCRETLAIDGFTRDELREELFQHADLFAEALRKRDTEARLCQVADALRAHAVPTQDLEDRANRIHIDLNQWRKAKTRTLMQRLLEDEGREGVLVQPKYHGTVTKLRESLRKTHHLREVADAIKKVKKKTRTYRLCIPAGKMRWSPPKK
ncbi:MAG: hypothetical protein QM570_04865 [Planctomycetota bacterium]|jgi:hypothetical protein|nr:hypothetical protein [Planctomycetota bacterium]